MLFLPLQDLRNYQYSLPLVEGLHIHMEMGNSCILIPRTRFQEVRAFIQRYTTRLRLTSVWGPNLCKIVFDLMF